jgi:transcriptional regulator with PAS, ATPase and Fis domain
LALLCEGEYAGNVRELEGIVLCAYLFARDQGVAEIDLRHLPPGLAPVLKFTRRGDLETNRIVVERVLRMTGGNVKKAAQLLGVSRTTVNTALRKTP